ncbi:MAG: hypothetical protein RR558_03060 [Coprobacillus sp.]
MKKRLWICLLMFSMLFVFLSPVYADMGPKPSINLDIAGLEGQKYYVTLLSKEESTGPYSVYNETIDGESKIKDNIFKKFVEYQDTDHYYFLQYFEECTQTSRFSWNYFPPKVFKVLIYLPETDKFIVSDIYEKEGFDSYYHIDVKELTEGNITLDISNDIIKTYQIESLLIRMALTVVIEVIIALCYHFSKKRQLLLILGVNILTQLILNIGLFTIDSLVISSINFIFMESIVIYMECKLYAKFLGDDILKNRIYGYTIFANMLSIVIGLLFLK